MKTTSRIWTLVLVAMLACAAVACGGDDGDDGASDASTETSAPTVGPDDSDTDGDSDTDDADADDSDGDISDGDGDLGPIATGLKTAMMAERVEVDGNYIHVYLDEDTRVPGGECVVANAAIPDGAFVVVHRGSDTTAC